MSEKELPRLTVNHDCDLGSPIQQVPPPLLDEYLELVQNKKVSANFENFPDLVTITGDNGLKFQVFSREDVDKSYSLSEVIKIVGDEIVQAEKFDNGKKRSQVSWHISDNGLRQDLRAYFGDSNGTVRSEFIRLSDDNLNVLNESMYYFNSLGKTTMCATSTDDFPFFDYSKNSANLDRPSLKRIWSANEKKED